MGEIANGQATKIFIPADTGATMGTIGGIAELIKGGDFPPASPNPARKPIKKPQDQLPKSAPAVPNPSRDATPKAATPKSVAPPEPAAPPASRTQWQAGPDGLPPVGG